MKPLLLLLTLFLVACAPEEKPSEPVCVTDGELYMVVYPDGETRKSRKFNCSNNCQVYYWVNDPLITFRECK